MRLIKEEKGRDSLDGYYEKKTTKFSLLLLKVPGGCETRCFAHFACLGFKKIFRKLE